MPYKDPEKNKAAIKRWNDAHKDLKKERDRVRYLSMREERLAQNKAWVLKNRERVRSWRKAKYASQREEVLKNNKAYAQARRRLVLAHYGGKCECCGEARLEFLCIDHINGGGRKHREKVGGGNAFYNWLIREGYPEGFRVLCHNCNSSLGFYGYCPHKGGTK